MVVVVRAIVDVVATSGSDVEVVATTADVSGAVAGVLPTVVHPAAHTATTTTMGIAKYRICYNHT
jgi:hypothetical protein